MSANRISRFCKTAIHQAESINLNAYVFNLPGTNTIAEHAEIMALAVMTAQEMETQFTFNGTAVAETNEIIDAPPTDSTFQALMSHLRNADNLTEAVRTYEKHTIHQCNGI